MSGVAVRAVVGAALAGLVGAGCGGAPRPPASPGPAERAAALATAYRAFLDAARSPAHAVDYALHVADGWTIVDPAREPPRPIAAGDRLVLVGRNRTALFVAVGREPVASAGAQLICTHIDTPSPRLLPSAPGSRGTLVASLYGAVRDYQWVGVPLALVGRAALAAEREVAIEIGLGDGFSFYGERTEADRLYVTAASVSDGAENEDDAGLTLLRYLRQRYGLTAPDLAAAELYFVPAWRAREVGVDGELIGAHGQDDRINSFAAWRALRDMAGVPARTAGVWWVDREEVSSTGAASARSHFLEVAFAWLLRAQGQAATELALARAFAATRALSADTSAALNPNFPEPHVDGHGREAVRLGRGPNLFPYAGGGGKWGSHTARAELIAEIREQFARAGVPLQVSEFGKVDAGGGGTISKYLANRGIDVVDVGIAVVSMHSPMELSAKADLLAGYRGYLVWLGAPSSARGGEP